MQTGSTRAETKYDGRAQAETHRTPFRACGHLGGTKAWGGVGLVAASLVFGACTSISSAPASWPATFTPPRCPSHLAFAVSTCTKSTTAGVTGHSSPVGAARSFANEGLQPQFPASGWKEEIQDGEGTTVVSAKTVLHVVRNADGT
jgi:hypothetical protein